MRRMRPVIIAIVNNLLHSCIFASGASVASAPLDDEHPVKNREDSPRAQINKILVKRFMITSFI